MVRVNKTVVESILQTEKTKYLVVCYFLTLLPTTPYFLTLLCVTSYSTALLILLFILASCCLALLPCSYCLALLHIFSFSFILFEMNK